MRPHSSTGPAVGHTGGASGPPVEAPVARLIAALQDLSMTRTREGVQEVVRHAARDLTGADGATFVLRDGDRCFYVDEDAIAPLWKGRRFPMSACISGWVMRNREPAVIEDIYEDSRIPADAYRPTFVRSLAMVPIRTREPVGAIGNYWARPHRAGEEDLRLLQLLADSTSTALENVDLIARLQAARESAEEANRLKDEFLATVSHELRTPLTPVVAWSDLLLHHDLDPVQTREALEGIHAGAIEELRQVESLLDVSRILAGQVRLETAPTCLESVARAAIESIASAAEAKGIDLDLEAGEGTPPVRGDAERLQQVAWNLLSNAVKFTPDGGRVRVRLERSDAHVDLVVSDTGRGIPARFVPHLFQRFRREDTSTTRSAGGMGLGLATVRHVVELHGGTVRAESPGSGEGATFTVSLPRS